LPVLELKPGANQVSILVVNERNIPLQDVHAAVQGHLPGWLKIADTIPVDVPPKGEARLGLNLQVGEVAPGRSFELPLVLKDRSDRIWEVRALVQVVAPSTYQLSQNFPNPFNPTTTIAFNIPSAGRKASGPSAERTMVRCRLLIYNLLGQRVRTLMDELRAGRPRPGSFTWMCSETTLAPRKGAGGSRVAMAFFPNRERLWKARS